MAQHQNDMFRPDRSIRHDWQPKRGDIIQVKADADPIFGGRVMVVEEVKSDGVVCFVDVPGSGFVAWRCPWAKLDFTGGRVLFMPELPAAA